MSSSSGKTDLQVELTVIKANPTKMGLLARLIERLRGIAR